MGVELDDELEEVEEDTTDEVVVEEDPLVEVEFLHFVGLLVSFLPVYFEKTDEFILYHRECRLPLTLLAKLM